MAIREVKQISHRLSLVDLAIISVLELNPMDSRPYESIVSLLEDSNFLAKEWFPQVEFSDSLVRPSLLRMLSAGLVTSHLDSSVDAQPIVPDPSKVSDYWYALSSVGVELLRSPLPWDYRIHQWTFPPEGSSLHRVVTGLREEPHLWIYHNCVSSPSLCRGFRGANSYLISLSGKIRERIVVHITQRLNVMIPELLHAHFRPDPGGLEGLERMPHLSIGDMDRMILDVLRDDIENISLILEVLNSLEAPYRKWHSGELFTDDDVVQSLMMMIEGGYVAAFEEIEEQTLELRPILSPRDLRVSDVLWFGLTAKGRAAVSEPWPWPET